MMHSSKPHCSTQVPTMPFGQYKGTPLDQLPSDYLLWVSCLNDLRQPLLGHVLREMARRITALERESESAATPHEVRYASR
jgi:uncharacterized protein (DUF3820 family)